MLCLKHLVRKLLLQVLDVLVFSEVGLADSGIKSWLLDLVLHKERVSHLGLLTQQLNLELLSSDLPRVKREAAYLALMLQLHHLHKDLLLVSVCHIFHHVFVFDSAPHTPTERFI